MQMQTDNRHVKYITGSIMQKAYTV